jgi:hypothetical protein
MYNITITYGAIVVNGTREIIVRKDASQSFPHVSGIDAYPSLHSTTVEISIKDRDDRSLPNINTTIMNSDGTAWKLTGNDGKAIFSTVYWGNDTAFTITWIGENGSMLATNAVMINSVVPFTYSKQLTFNYTFINIPVAINARDKYNNGFPATIIITNGSTVYNGTIETNGMLNVVLDEGSYSIVIKYPVLVIVVSSAFTVIKTTGTSFAFTAMIDAYPSLHSTTVGTTIKDALGRWIDGINVTLVGTGWNGTGITGVDGVVMFYNVYWGNGTTFTVTWRSLSGTVLNSSIVTIASTTMKMLPTILATQYIYTGLAITFSTIDKFNNGFSAIVQHANGTSIVATASIGIGTAIMNEGVYSIQTIYNAIVVNTTSITVRKSTGQSFMTRASLLDTYPSMHSTMVETSIKDALGRWIENINVTLVGTGWSGTGITGTGGKVTFYNVYWGYSTSFTVTWRDVDSTVLNTSVVTIESTAMKTLPTILVSQYFYTGLTVSFSTIDKFGNGFAADIKHVDDVPIVTTAATGTGTAVMDEGTWILRVVYNSRIVNDTIYITVRKNTGQSFVLIAPVDAYPALRSTTVDITSRDNAGRLVPGTNITMNNDDGTRWAVSGADGKVTFSSVYWGNDSTFTIDWIAPNGTVVKTAPLTLSSTVPVSITSPWTRRYIFPNVAISISVKDKFNDGFPARIILDNGTIVRDIVMGTSGIENMLLDEGSYQIAIEYPSSNAILSSILTIIKDVATSFAYPFTFDSNPGSHVATLVVHFEDSLGRSIHGVTCMVTGVDGTWQAMTGLDGNATIPGNYWGNSTSFTISWVDPALIDSTPFMMSESRIHHYSWSIDHPYIFKSLPVSFNFTDKNAMPFPAFVSFFKSGTIPSGSGAAGANGYYQTTMDEGNYIVKVEYPSGSFVANRSFTVNLANHTTRYNFAFPGFTSQIKICSLVVNVKDVLERNVYPVMVKINGTGIGNVAKSGITDGGGNVLFAGLAYQDYPSYTIYIYFNTAGTGLIGTLPVTIVADVQNANYVAPVQYHFPDIVTTFTVIDAFGIGYRANITVLDETNITIIASEITTDSGQRVLDLDEGTYTAVIRFNNTIIKEKSFTVIKDTANAHSISTSIDAYPDTHASTVTITIKDMLGRNIYGLVANMTSNETSYEATSTTGIYQFLSVYWGFDHWFNVTIRDSNGTAIDAFKAHVDGDVIATRTMPIRYVFRDVPITIDVIDSNDLGYAAAIIVKNASGDIVHENHASANGILMASLDEGNYTIEIYDETGTTLVDTMQIEVIDGTSISFHRSVPYNAHPPVFEVPWWAWYIIIPVAVAISIMSILATRAKRIRSERINREVKDKREFFEAIEGIEMVMCISNDAGVGIASFSPDPDLKDKEELASGMINALQSFGKEIKKDAPKSFKYANGSISLFKGEFVTITILDTTADLGDLFTKRVHKFLEDYELWHKSDLANFKGNITPFGDFSDKFGSITGAELLEPCEWRKDDILAIPLNAELKGILQAFDKKRYLNPTIKDFLNEMRVLSKTPSGNVYTSLHAIYEKGYVLPTRIMSTARNLERSLFNVENDADLAEFQEMQKKELSAKGNAIKHVDEQISKVNVKLVAGGGITKAQADVAIAKYNEEKAKIEAELKRIETFSFDLWKSNGKKFSLIPGGS